MPLPDNTIDLPAARDVIKPEPLKVLMMADADTRPFVVAAALNYFFEIDDAERHEYLRVAHINRVETALHELIAIDTTAMSERDAAEIEAKINALRALYAGCVREHDEQDNPPNPEADA